MSTIDINQLLGSIQNGNNTTNNNDDSDKQLLTLLLGLLGDLLNNQTNDNNQTQTNNTNNNDPILKQDSTPEIYKLIIDDVATTIPNPAYYKFIPGVGRDKSAPETIESTIQQARTHDLNGDYSLDKNDLAIMKDIAKKKIKPTDEQIKAGDFDNNGKVDDIDIYILTERLKPRAAGDVNGDGHINETDLEVAQDFAFGRPFEIDLGGGFLTDTEINAASGYGGQSITYMNEAFSYLKNVTHSREKGDINGDRKIDKSDLDVLNSLSDTSILSDSQIAAADFDGDGTYDKDKDTPLLKELVDKNSKPVKDTKKNTNKNTKTKKTKKKH